MKETTLHVIRNIYNTELPETNWAVEKTMNLLADCDFANWLSYECYSGESLAETMWLGSEGRRFWAAMQILHLYNNYYMKGGDR
jgi:hypothetical protein